MARVVFTRKARADLIDTWLHIAEDDPATADRVLDQSGEAAGRLADHPGTARNDIRPGLRYLISGSYLLLYRITDAGVEIVRVVLGRRDLFGMF